MKPALRPWHWAALAANLGLAAIALNDAVTHALTGQYSAASGTSGNAVAITVSTIVHGLAYLGIVVVLWREADAFRAANRFARALRPILLAAFGFMGLAMLGVETWRRPSPGESQGLAAGWELVGTVMFAVMLLGSCLLGFALLRSNPLGIGGRILLGILPAIGLVVLLGTVGSPWEHPGYIELVQGVGMSLLGVGATTRQLPRMDAVSEIVS
ncbi:MAG: hypothetical protein QM582_17675 [Micropruina sp.]|uniref:hypothetical protein n=1 Tax=Micropruina sp. TaxID=2737536 RepID=UPI0039E399FB